MEVNEKSHPRIVFERDALFKSKQLFYKQMMKEIILSSMIPISDQRKLETGTPYF